MKRALYHEFLYTSPINESYSAKTERPKYYLLAKRYRMLNGWRRMRVFQCRGKGGGGVKMTALKRNILSHLKITSFFFSFVTS